MSLSVQNGNLAASQQSLSLLAQEKLPVTTGLRVTRALKAVTDTLKEVEDARLALLKEYAVLDDTGNPVADEKQQAKFADEDTRKAYMAEVKKLLEDSSDVAVKKIPVSAFGDLQVAPGVLFALDWLVDDEEG